MRRDRLFFSLYLVFVIVRVLKRLPRWRRILSLSRRHDSLEDFTKIQEVTCASLILRARRVEASLKSRPWPIDIRERGKEKERSVSSLLLLEKKKKSKYLGERACEIGKRLLSRRGYCRQKIVHTFKVTRVSCGFKRLSRLTLSPEQFKLVLFPLVCVSVCECVGHIFARYFGERRLSEIERELRKKEFIQSILLMYNNIIDAKGGIEL